MGAGHHFARQQSSRPNVRFGSKSDIARDQLNVRFTPESGHWLSVSGCPLCAKSRHYAAQQKPSIVSLVLTPHIGRGGIKEMSDEPSCCLWIKCFNESDKFHCGRSTICAAVASGH